MSTFRISLQFPNRSTFQNMTGLAHKAPYTLCLKKDTALACYNFVLHQPILIIFSRNVAKKVRNQLIVYFSTLPN